MAINKNDFLISAALVSLLFVMPTKKADAEDCTGVLPGANCTLDEDTTAPLTIDSGITLTVGGSVLINHEIDADDFAGDGTISTGPGPITVDQNADIGTNLAINELLIADDAVWNANARIFTDNNGSDINLGAVDGGESLNFNNGGAYLGEIDGNNADTVTFGADLTGGDFTTGGQIESVTLIVSSGTLRANNAFGGGTALGGITIADGATIIQNANIASSGALDLDGTISIGAGNNLSADTYVADGDAGTIIIEVDRSAGTTETGELTIAAGGPLDLSNDTIRISLGDTSQVLESETISDFIVGNTGPSIDPNEFIESSYFYDFTLTPNGNNYDLVIAARSIDGSATTANNLTVANILLGSLAASEDPTFNRVQSLLGSDPTQEAFNERLESLQPTVDNGYVQSSINAKNQMHKFVLSRVNHLFDRRKVASPAKDIKLGNRLTSGSKDLKTGRRIRTSDILEPEEVGTVWAQAYAQSATQSNKDKIDGFSITSSGVVIGADSGDMNDDMIFGLAALVGGSDVESDNSNRTENEVRSYGVTGFGGVKLSAKTLLSGSVSYVHSLNELVRNDVGGIAGATATGEFPVEHFAMGSKLAYQYNTVNGIRITPSASIDYDHIRADPYTEFGTSELTMDVDYTALDLLALGIGVDLDYEYETKNGRFIYPTAYAKYQYDVLNDGVEVQSNFRTQPELFFKTTGFEPQRSILSLGTAVETEVAKDWRLALGYDLQIKDQYSSHAGYVNAIHDF